MFGTFVDECVHILCYETQSGERFQVFSTFDVGHIAVKLKVCLFWGGVFV